MGVYTKHFDPTYAKILDTYNIARKMLHVAFLCINVVLKTSKNLGVAVSKQDIGG